MDKAIAPETSEVLTQEYRLHCLEVPLWYLHTRFARGARQLQLLPDDDHVE